MHRAYCIKLFQRNISKFNHILILVIFTLLAVHALYYTYYLKQTIPIGDSWRNISRALIPYYENGFSLDLLWNDPVHPSPFRVLLLFANAKIFSLSFTLEKLVGIAFKILAVFLLINKARKTIGEQNNLSLIVMLLILFSFSCGWQYYWSVMSTAFFSIFLGVVYILVQDKLIKTESFNRGAYFQWIVIIILFLLAERDYAMIVLTAGIILLLIEGGGEQKPITIVYVITIMVLFYIICFYVFPLLTGQQDKNLTGLISLTSKLLENPKAILDTYALSLFSGFVSKRDITGYLGKTTAIFSGYLVLIFQIIIVYRAVKLKICRKASVPIMLIFIANIFFVTTVLKRYGDWHTPWLTVPDRYLIKYELGAAGLIWLYPMVFKLRRMGQVFLILIFLIVLASQTHGYFNAWQHADRINRDSYHASHRLVVFARGDLPRNRTGIPERLSIEEPTRFMQQHCLSVFRYYCETKESKDK